MVNKETKMQRMLLPLLAVLTSQIAATPKDPQEPLRIFIRAGKKTHGRGAHDHPRFANTDGTIESDRRNRTRGKGCVRGREIRVR